MDGNALYHAIDLLVGERVVRCVAELEREAEAEKLGDHDERQRERRIVHPLHTFHEPEAWIFRARIRPGDRYDVPGSIERFSSERRSRSYLRVY